MSLYQFFLAVVLDSDSSIRVCLVGWLEYLNRWIWCRFAVATTAICTPVDGRACTWRRRTVLLHCCTLLLERIAQTRCELCRYTICASAAAVRLSHLRPFAAAAGSLKHLNSNQAALFVLGGEPIVLSCGAACAAALAECIDTCNAGRQLRACAVEFQRTT